MGFGGPPAPPPPPPPAPIVMPPMPALPPPPPPPPAPEIPEPEPPPKVGPAPKTGAKPVQEARASMARNIASRNGRAQTRRSGGNGVSNYAWMQKKAANSGFGMRKKTLGNDDS